MHHHPFRSCPLSIVQLQNFAFVLSAAAALFAAGCGTDPAEPSTEESVDQVEPEPPDVVGTPVLSEIGNEEGFVALTRADFAMDGFGLVEEETAVTWSNRTPDLGGFLVRFDSGRGYLHTNDAYGNFTLRLDYRFPIDADAESPEDREQLNSGVFVFLEPPHKVWPRCLEVQGKWSEMGHIKSNDRNIQLEVSDDQERREQARRPPGEWNSLEIVTRDGTVTSFVNGVKICESQPSELNSGLIALQAEGDPVEFRHIRIRPGE
ncbi:3-keto-disaccharide hydrolase [Stratiformator vulcanicus]|uniref:3-keto-alpha-glucoside-1,2-lyase/3-keto-2-hydroxy-glucal hydratase domain-containing protein n=1 Tax=Stratiformator vulcanicus TaxID=2527980 RepID=A0A517QZA6_9PLAN|nr:DUF1080 domain-containing protein [Stratiformator vulcanicus]QDT36933.1 hypothetical protein Pan189_12970 [Stratiformator vulcanicus]